ncbi:MAG: hybrid sensor histidine kinase/response regulator [Cyanobacteria bacterium J06639_1]
MSFPSPDVERILAVDDSSNNLYLLQTILEAEGYHLTLADSGAAALDIFDRQPPHLLILDVMMPGMSGYEVTQQVRQRYADPFVPILLITANEKSDVVRGLDLGADDFVRKPMDVDELLARVRSLLLLKHNIDARVRMERIREDFVSRLTHDLRTPLVASNRVLHLMQQGAFGGVSDEMTEALSTTVRSHQTLIDMVNTLLEVNRYEADCKDLHFSPLDLGEAIATVTTDLTPLAAEKHLTLTFEADPKQPIEIAGARLEILRVFANLLGNAIRFTDSGGIAVNLRAKEGQAIAEVRDTGVGIALEERDRIFERFKQGSHTRAGHGLGLHLTRQIVEAHGGQIAIASEVGAGSTFTVSFPLAATVRNAPAIDEDIARV